MFEEEVINKKNKAKEAFPEMKRLLL